MARSRSIVLRRTGRCRRCRSAIPVGASAYFDSTTHELTCVDCRLGSPGRRRRRPAQLPLPLQGPDEQARIKMLIADARAQLDAARHAS
ncbi:MAG: hypothetical protein Q8K58_05550 [Acidimicrobiales bacterium]|nr:hypothetical protein [Acidimicrobiales bacterium]